MTNATTNSDTADKPTDERQNNPIDHDQLFKLLLTEFFAEFIALFFPNLAAQIEPGSLEFMDKELFTDIAAGSSHEADIIVKARLRGSEAFFIVHVENQSTLPPNFSRRMFWYFARLYEKYGLPVYPIVVFSYDAPLKAAPYRHTVRISDLLVLNFRYRVVQLNRLSWRKFAQNANPVAGALMAKMRIAPKDRPKVKVACLTLLGGLPLNEAQKQLLSVFVDTYLRLDREEEQTYRRELAKIGPVEEEKAMIFTTSWKEEGIVEGIQRGIVEGIQQGEALIISRQLTHRLGTLPAGLQERIMTLETEQLEALSIATLDFATLADAQAWIDAHS